MRIPSAVIDKKLAFVAVDATDLKTRKTGLTSFTVYRSRNGGTATVYTTPTIAELDAVNMPGVYVLTIDEDTTITAGVDEEEYLVHITQASMAPVTRAVELFRVKSTEGNMLDVNASGGAEVGTFQTGAITSAAFTAGAIDAAAIATDAIGSAELAASAATEIAGAVWDEASSTHTTAGTFGRQRQVIRDGTAQAGAAGTITLDSGASATNDFYNNTIITLVGGTGVGQARFISAYVGATKVASLNANWVTNPDATSVFVILPFGTIPGASAPTAAQNATAIWDELTATGRTAGSYGQLVKDDVNATISSRAIPGDLMGIVASGITSAKFAAGAIDAAAIAADAIGSSELATTAVDEIVNAVWDELTSEGRTAGSYGQLVKDDVNATISSRAIPGDLMGLSAGAITSAKFASGAIDAAAIATDAIGSAELSQGAADKVWSTTTRALTDKANFTLASGEYDNINKAVSGTVDSGSTTTVVDAERTEAATDYWKGSVIYFTGGGNIGATRRISAFNAATDTLTLAPALPNAAAIADTYIILRNEFAEVLVDAMKTDSMNAAALAADAVTEIQSGLATSTAVSNIQTDTDDIQTRLPAALVTGRMDSSVGAMATGVVTATAIAADAIGASELATDAAAEIAGAVWDEARSSHTTAGTFGRSAQVVRDATAQAGAASTITLDASASATNDFYNNTIIAIVGGTGVGQARFISAYVGATKVATVNANWVTNPDATSIFVILFFGSVATSAPTAAQNATAVWDELTATGRTAASYGQLVKDDVNATISSRSTLTAAQVKTQVTDALNVDTYAEPVQGAPAATTTLVSKLGFLYKAWRNRVAATATQYSLYNDDAVTVDHKATLADDGTAFSRTEVATGP